MDNFFKRAFKDQQEYELQITLDPNAVEFAKDPNGWIQKNCRPGEIVPIPVKRIVETAQINGEVIKLDTWDDISEAILSLEPYNKVSLPTRYNDPYTYSIYITKDKETDVTFYETSDKDIMKLHIPVKVSDKNIAQSDAVLTFQPQNATTVYDAAKTISAMRLLLTRLESNALPESFRSTILSDELWNKLYLLEKSLNDRGIDISFDPKLRFKNRDINIIQELFFTFVKGVYLETNESVLSIQVTKDPNDSAELFDKNREIPFMVVSTIVFQLLGSKFELVRQIFARRRVDRIEETEEGVRIFFQDEDDTRYVICRDFANIKEVNVASENDHKFPENAMKIEDLMKSKDL